MFKTNYGHYKYLGFLAAMSITFELISNFVGARLVALFGFNVSDVVYTFPVVYLVSDVVTEVYGYTYARSVVWLSLICRVVSATAVWTLLLIPPSPNFHAEDAYQITFSTGFRLAAAGVVALFIGDMCNSYVLARLKVWSKGQHLWLRFVLSTFVGESIHTTVYYCIVFHDVLSAENLALGIMTSACAKTLWEVIALPVTYPLVAQLKKVENVDHYDRHTNFNPFITDVTR